ncbi:hypothetical protein QFC21_001404 [Naganishia friedmannii]|uniref:Uncharacterized protein n=1 Tax=Naganishia friedmannii TaxID=89922 RepID=A0ACC2W4Z2_9TREE|nr:hypothetical protein QFC21_001404 [Naganishia friedmannii]
MSHSDSAETTEGDETTAAEMIESKMETMRMVRFLLSNSAQRELMLELGYQTIEDLEDAVVLMRQAIASQPSSNIHIFGHSPAIVPREETELNGKLKSKKEKKSKRSKLGTTSVTSLDQNVDWQIWIITVEMQTLWTQA